MPETFNKRQSSPRNPPKEKGKTTAKVVRGGSKDGESIQLSQDDHCQSNLETASVSDKVIEDAPENVRPEPVEPKRVPLVDVMRQEPRLVPLVVVSYKGGKDEQGFYHGEGAAEFYGGHSYEGWFEHGKMHGQGIYMWEDGISYAGDFKCNVINGKGVYTWPDGTVYEGEVCNGLRHGIGTYSSSSSSAVYDGEWVSGKRNGNGTLYFDEKQSSYYSGFWVENKKCGHGVLVYDSGNKYEGEWSDNLRHGKGHMYWYGRGEDYYGDWHYGAMTGVGTYTWYIKRAAHSQYPLRNQYHGQFLNGERHGCGIFHYASGASYSGQWCKNSKHGKGKFTFKNGTIFEGIFENDKIVGAPDVPLSGFATPDIEASGLPVRSQTPLRSSSVTGTGDNVDISLAPLFQEYQIDIVDQQKETENVFRVLLQHISPLRTIYRFYSSLGQDTSYDNTYILSMLQMWRLLKDAGLPGMGFSLADIDRANAVLETTATDLHNPFKKIFFREFVNMLIMIAIRVMKFTEKDLGRDLGASFSRFLTDILFPNAFLTSGCYFTDASYTSAVNQYIDLFYEVFLYFERAKKTPQIHLDKCLTMRDFLFMFKDLRLITENLQGKDIVRILLKEIQPDLANGMEFNLNFEIVFLDFMEVLIDCGQRFVSDDMCEQFLESISPGPLIQDAALSAVSPEDFANNAVTANDVLILDQQQSGNEDATHTSPTHRSEHAPATTEVAINSADKQEKQEKAEKQEKQGKENISREKSKDTPKSSEGKMKGKKEEKGSGKEKEKKDKGELRDAGKKSNEALPPKRDKSKDSHMALSPEGKQRRDSSLKESIANRVLTTPPAIVTSDSQEQIEVMLDTSSPQDGETPKNMLIAHDSGHPIQRVQSKTSLELWSLKLHIFVENHLVPAFKQRKKVDDVMDKT